MGWMDDLLGKNVLGAGTLVPDRKKLNFLGTVSVTDNPQTESTDVTIIGGGGGVNLDPLEPQSNGGTTAYPTNPAYSIRTGFTFVRSGAADFDSVRMYGAGGSEPNQNAFDQGTLINLSGFVLSFYPLLTQHLYLNGADAGAGVPFSIAPGSAVRWVLDDALNLYILL